MPVYREPAQLYGHGQIEEEPWVDAWHLDGREGDAEHSEDRLEVEDLVGDLVEDLGEGLAENLAEDLGIDHEEDLEDDHEEDLEIDPEEDLGEDLVADPAAGQRFQISKNEVFQVSESGLDWSDGRLP